MNRVVGGQHRCLLPNCRRRRGARRVVCEGGDDTGMSESMLLAQLIGDSQFRLDPSLTHLEEADTEKVHERGAQEYGFDLLAEVGHCQDGTHTRSSGVTPTASRRCGNVAPNSWDG